jgi:hypothetical protein
LRIDPATSIRRHAKKQHSDRRASADLHRLQP